MNGTPKMIQEDGDVYAQGYIDVEMKIYRVKWLCNVSISRFNSNFNLLEGTKDFSGGWWFSEGWYNDGTYKGLTVKRKDWPWGGIAKLFIAPKSGVYTFSAYVKGFGNIQRFVTLNGANVQDKWQWIGDDFDWTRDSFSINLNAGDKIYVQYNSVASGTLWTAGHKWEYGSIATPYMQAESEITNKWNVTKTGMLVSQQTKQITMVQAGALMRCEINNNISGWTDGTTQLNYSGQDFVIDGYGMRGLHNG